MYKLICIAFVQLLCDTVCRALVNKDVYIIDIPHPLAFSTFLVFVLVIVNEYFLRSFCQFLFPLTKITLHSTKNWQIHFKDKPKNCSERSSLEQIIVTK